MAVEAPQARCSLAALLVLLPVGCAAAGAGGPPQRIVDLSHAYDADTISWPTEEGFALEDEHDGMTDAGYYYAANRFRSAEHVGTHIDAPVHFHQGGWTLEEIPLEHLVGDAVLVDVSAACARDRDYQVGPADFEAWEAQHGPIEPGAIVLLRTGFERFWPDRVSYMGTDLRGPEAVAKLHFPGLHPDGARWLVARGVHAVGLDTPSIDFGQSQLFWSHRLLFAANVPAFENLANLSQLPARGFRIAALPMKIRGGSGGPLRIVAFIPQGD